MIPDKFKYIEAKSKKDGSTIYLCVKCGCRHDSVDEAVKCYDRCLGEGS